MTHNDSTAPQQEVTGDEIDAGPYSAVLTLDGYIRVYDGNDFLFSLSPGFPREHVREVCEKASRCRAMGYVEGGRDRAARIRAMLDCPV